MYRKNVNILETTAFPSSFVPSDHPEYRPFSYYVLGGIDVDGDSLLMNADVGVDSDSDIESGCSVDGSCDPRVSAFDIAEQVGIDAYEKVKEKAQRSQSKSESSDSDNFD